MRNIFKTIALAVILAGSISCQKDKLEVEYNKQEAKISSYIESAMARNESYTTVNNGGSNRLTTVQGTGEALKADGNLTFYYAGYTFNGNVSTSGLFTTNHKVSADNAGWELTDAEYEALTINLKDYKLLDGLKKGLEGVKAGEECEIIFSGKYGFGNDSFGIVPANSALLYKIWVISISNE